MKRAGENAGVFIDMLVDIGRYEHQLRRVDPMYREMDDLWVDGSEGERVKLNGWDKFSERAYDRVSTLSSHSSWCKMKVGRVQQRVGEAWRKRARWSGSRARRLRKAGSVMLVMTIVGMICRGSRGLRSRSRSNIASVNVPRLYSYFINCADLTLPLKSTTNAIRN
jgi:hypothetical protein